MAVHWRRARVIRLDGAPGAQAGSRREPPLTGRWHAACRPQITRTGGLGGPGQGAVSLRLRRPALRPSLACLVMPGELYWVVAGPGQRGRGTRVVAPLAARAALRRRRAARRGVRRPVCRTAGPAPGQVHACSPKAPIPSRCGGLEGAGGCCSAAALTGLTNARASPSAHPACFSVCSVMGGLGHTTSFLTELGCPQQ